MLLFVFARVERALLYTFQNQFGIAVDGQLAIASEKQLWNCSNCSALLVSKVEGMKYQIELADCSLQLRRMKNFLKKL